MQIKFKFIHKNTRPVETNVRSYLPLDMTVDSVRPHTSQRNAANVMRISFINHIHLQMWPLTELITVGLVKFTVFTSATNARYSIWLHD